MTPGPLLLTTEQKACGDCAIACLATWLRENYHDVFSTASSLLTAPHKRGMYTKDMIRIAKKFGVKLKRKRKFDLEKDSGILAVRMKVTPQNRKRWMIPKVTGKVFGHSVILMRGLIFDCSDGAIWDAQKYVEHFKMTSESLLITEGRDS